MRSGLRSSIWLTHLPPGVAIEIAGGRVTVAELTRTGAGVVVSAHASEPLATELVTPNLVGSNVPDPGAVADAVREALGRAGLRSVRRAALVIPDSAVRVTLLPFEQVPARASDLDQLIRLQLRKATPFPIDQAQVATFTAGAGAGVTTIAAIVSRRDVVVQYEAVADALGIHAGIVDVASMNVMNTVIGSGQAPADDWLLVSLAADATTLAILRGHELLFYRHRTAADLEPLEALVHQTSMYHEDRLGGRKFARVWLAGAGRAARGFEAVRREITDRLGVPAEPVDCRHAAELRDRVAAGVDVLDALAAPVGILLRERKAA
jgi:Tfp pilus assembly PilM family ATPase